MASHAWETQRKRPTDLAGSRARISVMTSVRSTGASWLLSAVGAGGASSPIPLVPGGYSPLAAKKREPVAAGRCGAVGFVDPVGNGVEHGADNTEVYRKATSGPS
jgi:hypothetical protein